MAEVQLPEFDWDEVEFEVTELPDKSPEHIDVPEWVIKLAQASWDRKRRNSFTVKKGPRADEYAAEFERLIRGAGRFVTTGDSPEEGATMTVSRDGIVVFYRAGKKRGAKSAASKSEGTEK